MMLLEEGNSYIWKEGFTHFETTNHSHDSTIHIELIDALHTQCFAVQLRFEPPKKLLFGRSKMRNRNTLLHFLRIMYATYTVYIPTLSGNPFLINQLGFYWLNSAFRQSELRSMGPAPEVWDVALWNFRGIIPYKISADLETRNFTSVNKKIDLPELVESTFFHGKSGTETPPPGTAVSIGAKVDAQVPLKLVSSTRWMVHAMWLVFGSGVYEM